MSVLASTSVAILFTISTDQWTAINKRIGSVLAIEGITLIISQDLPGYPDLLLSSKQWVASTFNGLILNSGAIAGYANTAITNFTDLNNEVKKIVGNTVPLAVQEQTRAVLGQLLADTSSIVGNADQLAKELRIFLTANKVVDAEIALNKKILDSFWAPLGIIITNVEAAAGAVTGTWSAILDDLKNTVASDLNVTLPFIESLDIDAALISWQDIKSEAAAFPANMSNQENYWKSI